MVDGDAPQPGLFPPGVGERLRLLREKAGLDLHDIATRTRIPLRHLEAIEKGDFAALPSPTYSLGFTRAFARAVGADEHALAHDLREELGREQPGDRAPADEPADPARVPPRLLAWTAAVLALLIAVGYGIWRSNWLDGAAVPVEVVAPTHEAAPVAVASSTPAAAGEVVLKALAPVWLRVTDEGGHKLIERELAQGESFAVPPEAKGPKIQTGRAESIAVSIDGRPVAPLGPPATTIKDLDISAAALSQRSTGAPAGEAR